MLDSSKKIVKTLNPLSEKPAWRIDSFPLRKYASSVFYIKDNRDIDKLKKDILISQSLQIKGVEPFVCNEIMGYVFEKTKKQPSQSMSKKVSIYSEWSQNPKPPILLGKLKEFLGKIQNNLEALNKMASIPKEFEKYITFEELRAIYTGIIRWKNESLLKKLEAHRAYRLSKESSGFSHTLNLIVDPFTQDIYLMLETKSKVKDALGITIKNLQETPKFIGNYKITKPALRIDCSPPEKYANSVVYLEKPADLEEAKKEVMISQALQLKDTDTHINKMIMGRVFSKPCERETILPDGKKEKKVFNKKISIYSMWAEEGNLAQWLHCNPCHDSLTINEMALQLLTAVQILHEKGWVHQDIKPENILVFNREEGGYRLALTDFGTVDRSHFPKGTPIAAFRYESPEISAAHFYYKGNPGFYYDYFHSESAKNLSYGQEVFMEAKQFYKQRIKEDIAGFCLANQKNDMWATGLLLYELYKGSYPMQQPGKIHPEIVEGLLCPERKKRFNATHALLLQYLKVGKMKPAFLKQEFVAGEWAGLNLLEYAIVHKEDKVATSLLNLDVSLAQHTITQGHLQEDTPLTLSFSYSEPPLVRRLLELCQHNDNFQESLEIGRYRCNRHEIRNKEVRELIFSSAKKREAGRHGFSQNHDVEDYLALCREGINRCKIGE